jgi:integrase
MAITVSVYKRKLGKDKTGLYLKINDNGSRRFESLGITYKDSDNKKIKKELLELAEEKRSQLQLELISEGSLIAKRNKGAESFIEYWENFMETKVSGVKNSNYYGFNSSLIQFKAFLKAEYNGRKNISIKEVNEDVLEKYVNFLHNLENEDGEPLLGQNSINKYFNKLSAVLHDAVKKRILGFNPATNISNRPKAVPVDKVYLEVSELEKLIKTPCKIPDVKRAFLFSCFTGLRFSDIQKLTWGEIRNETIHFRQKKTYGFEHLPLHKNALEIINQKAKDGIIPMDNVKIFKLSSKGRVNFALRLWVMESGIKNKHITYHTSRHTYATLALSSGVDIYIVSKLLGHKNIETTQIYAKIIGERLKHAVNQIPVFELAL